MLDDRLTVLLLAALEEEAGARYALAETIMAKVKVYGYKAAVRHMSAKEKKLYERAYARITRYL